MLLKTKERLSKALHGLMYVYDNTVLIGIVRECH